MRAKRQANCGGEPVMLRLDRQHIVQPVIYRQRTCRHQDRYGYDYGWFLCLFVIAAYMRLYGIPALERRRNALFLYAGMSLAIFGLTAAVGLAAGKVPALAYYMDMPVTYNHILCLAGAVGLFMVFKNVTLPGFATKAVTRSKSRCLTRSTAVPAAYTIITHRNICGTNQKLPRTASTCSHRIHSYRTSRCSCSR